MEMRGWWEVRARAMRGSLMVATEPVAARRTWCLLSWAWSAAEKKGEGDVWVVGGVEVMLARLLLVADKARGTIWCYLFQANHQIIHHLVPWSN